MKKAKITIEGMHCASCSSNVEKALSKIPGVEKTKVNLLFKKATVELDESVERKELEKAVKDAGYKATDINFS